MQNNIRTLIERIKESDLSEDDKRTLIEKLDGRTPDIPGFVSNLALILRVSKEMLRLFDIDLGDDL